MTKKNNLLSLNVIAILFKKPFQDDIQSIILNEVQDLLSKEFVILDLSLCPELLNEYKGFLVRAYSEDIKDDFQEIFSRYKLTIKELCIDVDIDTYLNFYTKDNGNNNSATTV